MAKFQAPRGTLDILPEQQPYWQWILSEARAIAGQYGFRPIEVPVFEETEVFARGVGTGTDIVEKEMYTFEDRGGRSLTLRPEFTAGIVRAYIEHGMHVLPQPVRLYSIGPVFRYEAPQAGRYRQHTQFSCECIGEADPLADFEIMSMAWDLFDRLGFAGLRFEINSIGCPACRPRYLRDVLIPYLESHRERLPKIDQERLQKNPLRVLDSKEPETQPIIAEAPVITDALCDECRAHFDDLRHYLDLMGRDYVVNPHLVRGLDYYTKTVFEVKAEGALGAQNTICAGGRYDGLVELLGGAPTPGVGFAAGIERIMLLLQEQGIQPPPLEEPVVFFVHRGQAAKDRAVQLAHTLRAAGIGAEIAFGSRSFKSQLRQAGRSSARFAAILAEGELERGEVTLKDLESGEQTSVPQEGLVAFLQACLSE
nr:histidine--tRNA ligase [Ardenticatena sp.]